MSATKPIWFARFWMACVTSMFATAKSRVMLLAVKGRNMILLASAKYTPFESVSMWC